MRIPFDIKYRPQIESGEYKVETKDGREVRIVCWDVNSSYSSVHDNILALVKSESGVEHALFYAQNGYCLSDSSRVGRKDLFLVTPEPELTPLEDLLSTYLKNDFEYFSTKKWDEKKWNEVMRIQAAELLPLARKQLQPEIDAMLEDAYKTADEVQYRKGREEALRDLPRWREWDNGAAGNSEGHPIALVSDAGGIRFVSVLGVHGEKYIMLDDLKKLPGFKED